MDKPKFTQFHNEKDSYTIVYDLNGENETIVGITKKRDVALNSVHELNKILFKERATANVEFKQGDKITLNTGYVGDSGKVIVDYGNVVFWENKERMRYCSPRNKYTITLRKD